MTRPLSLSKGFVTGVRPQVHPSAYLIMISFQYTGSDQWPGQPGQRSIKIIRPNHRLQWPEPGQYGGRIVVTAQRPQGRRGVVASERRMLGSAYQLQNPVDGVIDLGEAFPQPDKIIIGQHACHRSVWAWTRVRFSAGCRRQ